MRKYMLERYQRRKRLAIKALGGKCVHCGTKNKLQFDHIDPKDKDFTIAKIWSYSKERFWIEIKKCQLLCRDCHNIKTQKELGKKVAKGNHGTLSTYRYCRCELCKQAKREYAKIYRRRKGPLAQLAAASPF